MKPNTGIYFKGLRTLHLFPSDLQKQLNQKSMQHGTSLTQGRRVFYTKASSGSDVKPLLLHYKLCRTYEQEGQKDTMPEPIDKKSRHQHRV
ncbi:hypothetical protein Tco_0961277 [Tanacetum coccineum]